MVMLRLQSKRRPRRKTSTSAFSVDVGADCNHSGYNHSQFSVEVDVLIVAEASFSFPFDKTNLFYSMSIWNEMYTNDVFPGEFMSMQPIKVIDSPHDRFAPYSAIAVPSRKTSDLSQYINPAANEKAAKAIRAHYGQVPADKYKTVMCQTWLETAKCRFGARCKFAHGESELRSNNFESSMAANRKYKTRVCDKFVNQGICPYGERCLFIHPDVSYLQPTDYQFQPIDNCQIPFSTSAVGFSRSMYSVQWSTATNTQLDMPSHVPVMLPTAASCSSFAQSNIWASGTDTPSDGSPTPNCALASNRHIDKDADNDTSKDKSEIFDDSMGCLTELHNKLADGLLDISSLEIK